MQNLRTCTYRGIISSQRSCSLAHNRIGNRHFVINQIRITDDVTRQRLISRRPIDKWYEGSALSLRRLSNEVEEQIVRLNNAPWIAAASCYADRNHRPGLF